MPHGKALVAKELGAWTGADGYYHEDGIFEQDDDEEGEEKEETDVYKAGAETMGSGRESLLPPRQQQSQQQQQQTYRRYLALDSHALSMNNRDVNHHPTYLRAMLAVMVAVAKATGRILILPAVFHDAFYVYAWNHLDLKSVRACSHFFFPSISVSSRSQRKSCRSQLSLLSILQAFRS